MYHSLAETRPLGEVICKEVDRALHQRACYACGLGLGAFGGSPGLASGAPLGFAVFGAPGGATVPGVGPTGGSPGGRSVGAGAVAAGGPASEAL
jgi:hypothetical protein